MLQIDIAIKFRFLGRDFGNWKEHAVKVALPMELALVAGFIGKKQLFAYNQHGVAIVLALVAA